jgi:translation elongation factor EF-1alpha
MMVKNISLLGHKDHGKSTLIGSLLMNTGSATQVRINEAKTYSKKMHKSFEPAFILDSFAEERTGEMTIDTTRAEIKYKNLAFAFIDVPGHEELIKNMISGASYGETAVLLVSAKKDEGIRDQTKRHLFISRMLGIGTLVVAVNKMDLVGYDEKRFEEIKRGLVGFIEKIGFEKKNVYFVPISAYNGENLVKKSMKMKWYRGGTLLEFIYKNATRKTKNKLGALRIVVQGIIDRNEGIIGGKIINGQLRTGHKISILPMLKNAKVTEIIVKGKRVKKANVGENVAIRLDRKAGFEMRGTVIAEANDKPVLTSSIRAKIFVTNKFVNQMKIKFNGIDIKCNRIKILEVIDTRTGEKSNSKTAEVLDAVEAKLQLEKKLPIEEFETTKELGRFVLYNKNEFAGVGVITKIR